MKRPIPQVDLIALFEHYGGEVTGPDNSLWRKAKCCIHEDGTSSAVVNEEEGVWRCFTCDLGGDAIQLIMEKTGARFVDALRLAEDFAQRGGAAVPREPAGSSLLSGRPRSHSGGGTFVPPWRRI